MRPSVSARISTLVPLISIIFFVEMAEIGAYPAFS